MTLLATALDDKAREPNRLGLFDRLDRSRGLSEHELEFISVFREFVRDKITPHAERHDQEGTFPWDNVKALNGLDLNTLFLPVEHGGAGTSYLCYLRIVEELSRGCPATAITWATTYHAISPLLHYGTPEQQARILPAVANGALAALAITEDSGGSDVSALRTVLRPDGDEIVIDGRKLFITNGGVADFYLVMGRWTEIDDPRGALTAVLIEKDTPGLEVLRLEAKMGHRASATAELGFDNCRIPRANLLGAPGDGLPILLYALNRSRPSVAAHAMGIAHAAFEEAVAHTNVREQFGQRLLDFQGVQFMIADMAIKLTLAQSWLMYLGRMIDEGADSYFLEASLLKIAASDLAVEMASNAVQLHGGYGYMEGTRVERLFRDAKLSQIWEGANELHRQHLGRAFLDRR